MMTIRRALELGRRAARLAPAALLALASLAAGGRAATLAVANNRFGVRADSTRTWTEDDPPTTADSISWWTGPNLADDKRYLRIFEGSETKFSFTFSGGLLTPPGKDFIGFAPGGGDLVQGPGTLGSTCVTHGHGKSYGNTVGDETTYSAEWHLLADGTITSQPAGGETPQWFSTSRAQDPICLKPTDLIDVAPSPTCDLAIPIQIGAGSLGHGGFHVHVSYETADGSVDLTNVFVGGDGVDVIPGALGSGTLRFYQLDAMQPPAATDVAISAADLGAAIHAQSSGGSIVTPIDIAIVCGGIPTPTTDMGDGSVAKIHVDSDCWDRNSLTGLLLRTLSQRAVGEDGAGTFVIPEQWPCAQLSFDPSGPPGPGSADASMSLYGLAGGSWVLLHDWQWNAGTTRVVAPMAGIDVYRLVDASNLPVPCHVSLPVTPLAPSPDLPTTLPDFALGGVDLEINPFNAGLGVGGGAGPTFNVQPGLPLQAIPRCVGANHWQYVSLQFNVQPDPTRPWLYVNGNPGMGFVQPSYLTLSLDGLFDPFGGQLPTLPIAVQVIQGATQHTFQGTAHYDQNGKVVFPPIDLGSLLAQPYTLVIGVPPGGQLMARPESPDGVAAAATAAPLQASPAPGYFSMNGVVVAIGAPAPAAVTGPRAVGEELALSAPAPNPVASGTRFAVSLPERGAVRVGVFDLGGREVRRLVDTTLEPGAHEMSWDGRDARDARALPGMYFVRVDANGATATRKLALTR